MRKKNQSSAGASFIEFMLVVPIILGLIAVSIDFARLLYTKQMMQAAAKRGANEASVAPDVDSEDKPKQEIAIGKVQTEVASFFESMHPVYAHIDLNDGTTYKLPNKPFSVEVALPNAGMYGNDIKAALAEEPIRVSIESDFHFIMPFLSDKRIRVAASRYRELASDSSQPISTDCLGKVANVGTGGSKNCPCSLVLAPPRDPSTEEGTTAGGCDCKGDKSRMPPEEYLKLVKGDFGQMPAGCADAFDEKGPKYDSPAYKACSKGLPCTSCTLSCGPDEWENTSGKTCDCVKCPAGLKPNSAKTGCICATPVKCDVDKGETYSDSTQCGCVTCAEPFVPRKNGGCVCDKERQAEFCDKNKQIPTIGCGCKVCKAPKEYDELNKRCICQRESEKRAFCFSIGNKFNDNSCTCEPCTGGLVFDNDSKKCICRKTQESCNKPLILVNCQCVKKGKGE